MVHVRATHDGTLNTGTGGRLPAGSTIVTVFDVTPESPFSSRTVSVTVKVAADVYVFVGTGPEPDPWPKFHEYVSVGVTSSVEVRPSNSHSLATHEKVKFATGGRLL